MEDNKIHSDITSVIIEGFYNVYNQLSYGFLEKVYQNALYLELRKLNLDCKTQVGIDVFYDDSPVGLYYADIIVNNLVIVEIKAAEALCKQHEAQVVNYLKATDIEVGLLFNFGVIPEFKRKVFTAPYKKHLKKQ